MTDTERKRHLLKYMVVTPIDQQRRLREAMWLALEMQRREGKNVTKR